MNEFSSGVKNTGLAGGANMFPRTTLRFLICTPSTSGVPHYDFTRKVWPTLVVACFFKHIKGEIIQFFNDNRNLCFVFRNMIYMII